VTTPKNEVVQIEYQNPDATNKLLLPTLVICNTTDEIVEQNIRENSAKPLKWLKTEKEHEGSAILVGGGASIEDEIDTIRALIEDGGTVFAMNAASQWLHSNDIKVDYQCIADAKEETSKLIDHRAKRHIIASQSHPKTMDSVIDPLVWHLGIYDIESFFPEERVKNGGYAVLGGGAAVGNSATCVAYALGFRELHIFGFDSCHKEGRGHAYTQFMNVFIPTMTTRWAGKEFESSVAMKAQAEKFMFTSNELKKLDCTFHVYGEGLLQTMYHTRYDDLTEQEKYQLMWNIDAYREVSPGEYIAEMYLKLFKPKGLIIDYGCGTGRAGVKFSEAGHDVLLIDFTDNCRDDEAHQLAFMQWDLTNEMTQSSEHGFCTDVMEHIPTKDVKKVINNIMNSSKKVFFQISTVNDSMGVVIDQPLHLTVKPHSWWKNLFTSNGYEIEWEQEQEIASLFYITNPDRRKL
jgi:uncharacterized Rossmann fold enzyme